MGQSLAMLGSMVCCFNSPLKINFKTPPKKRKKTKLLTIVTGVLLDQGAGCGFKGIGTQVVERHQAEPEGGVRMRHGVQLLLRQLLGNVVLLVALHHDQVAAITVRRNQIISKELS